MAEIRIAKDRPLEEVIGTEKRLLYKNPNPPGPLDGSDQGAFERDGPPLDSLALAGRLWWQLLIRRIIHADTFGWH